jgi:SAM-dependent methyltransferase
MDGVPAFTDPPRGLVPSEKLARGPHAGTPWRQENWRFLAEQVARLETQALILDVGAGRGDFADVFGGYPNYLALDVYPYPEVDLVCDLSTTNPFKPRCLDAIILMNVLEHVYDAHSLLAALAKMLKPGGDLIVAVPFMVKMHQAPVDFARYTHYALQRMGPDNGLETVHLEGFYDPVSVLTEGTGNLKNAVLPEVKGYRRYAARLLSGGLQSGSGALRRVLGPGKHISPDRARSHAPTGYEVVYRKNAAG